MDQCTLEVRLQHWKKSSASASCAPRDRPQNNGWMKMVSVSRHITAGSALSSRKPIQK